MKILIVKLGSIGDVVHTLPALAAIRRSLPEAEISWVVERRSAEILRENPLLSRLIEIDTRGLRARRTSVSDKLVAARQQLKDLRAEKYDVALDFQGLHKSAVIAKLSGAHLRIGFDRAVLREPTSRFLLNETVRIPAKAHIVEKNLWLAAKGLKINVPISSRDFEFPVETNAKHEAEVEKTIGQTGENFAILNPGGGWTTKLWDAENYGRLADELWRNFEIKSVVTFGPGEEPLAGKAIEASRSKQAFPASLSLKGFYALARRARVYVGGDTGPTHLAVAARAPVVGLFGPTAWWRNGSPFADDICVERTDINCRTDCHRRACSNWVCMDIEIERVLRAVEKRLELSAKN